MNYNKEVLIFGLGKQGRKYCNYFISNGYNITGVTKTGLNKLNIQKMYSFSKLSIEEKEFFSKFSLIIVAVHPIEEQTKVIKHLVNLKLKNSIIIEKPISYEMLLIKKIQNYDNIIFFIDEIRFYKIFMYKNIPDISIFIDMKDTSLLEHSMGFFLFNKDFKNILKNMQIYNFREKNVTEYMKYNLLVGKYNIKCIKGVYWINNRVIGNNIFNYALDICINKVLFNKKMLRIYKYNFYLLQEHIGSNHSRI